MEKLRGRVTGEWGGSVGVYGMGTCTGTGVYGYIRVHWKWRGEQYLGKWEDVGQLSWATRTVTMLQISFRNNSPGANRVGRAVFLFYNSPNNLHSAFQTSTP